jgi:hypothetical protein
MVGADVVDRPVLDALPELVDILLEAQRRLI